MTHSGLTARKRRPTTARTTNAIATTSTSGPVISDLAFLLDGLERADKYYMCNESECGRSFSRRADLKRHGPVHTGEKAFSCSLCNKSFKQQAGLKIHMNSHTGAKPYKCLVCGTLFSDPSSANRHKEEKHSEPFMCDQDKCNKKTKRKSDFLKHLRAAHGYSDMHLEDLDLESFRRPPVGPIRNRHVRVKAETVSEMPVRPVQEVANAPGKPVERDGPVSPGEFSDPSTYFHCFQLPSEESSTASSSYEAVTPDSPYTALMPSPCSPYLADPFIPAQHPLFLAEDGFSMASPESGGPVYDERGLPYADLNFNYDAPTSTSEHGLLFSRELFPEGHAPHITNYYHSMGSFSEMF